MWTVYMIECSDGRLYTGITTDLKRRVEEHRRGQGAKFTRAFGAERVCYRKRYRTRSNALRAEAALKKKTRAEKWALIRSQPRN